MTLAQRYVSILKEGWKDVFADRRTQRLLLGIALPEFGHSLSDAGLEPRDDIANGLALGACRERQRHAMLENGLGEIEHVVDRRRQPAVEQRARPHREHQGLARARARPPADQLGGGIALRAGTRRANQREDRLDHGLSDRQPAHQALRDHPGGLLGLNVSVRQLIRPGFIDTNMTVSAPIAGAALRRPKPVAPTLRMSVAKIGKSAMAPPNSTANRSSAIDPIRI